MSRLGVLRKSRPVGVGMVVIAAAVASCSSGLLGLQLPAGSNTATIIVTIPRSGQPSFTGTVAGGTLTGTVQGATYPSGSATPFFTYKGSAGGHRFVLHVGISTNQSGNPQKGLFGGFHFVVTGTYGSESIKATASYQVANIKANTVRVPFDGHIGSQRVTGIATARSTGRGLAIAASLSID